MRDSCLEPGKIEALKMLDLQAKSALISNKLQVQHQATNHASFFAIGRCLLDDYQQVKHQDRNKPFPYVVVLLRSKIATDYHSELQIRNTYLNILITSKFYILAR